MAAASSGKLPVLVKTPDGTEMDVSHWVMVYPCYLDGRKTAKEGRKVAKEICKDCTEPNILDIQDCCHQWGLKFVREVRKRHPRDWRNRGRVRVELKDEQGNIVNENFPTRKNFFQELARTIPTLETRKQRIEAMKRQGQANEGKQVGGTTAAESQSGEAAAATGSTRKNRKKDRKQRRKQK